MIVRKSPCIPDEIRLKPGLDPAYALDICRGYVGDRRPERVTFKSPEELTERLASHTGQLIVELSSRDQVLLDHGCIDACPVHPEESDKVLYIYLPADVLEEQAS